MSRSKVGWTRGLEPRADWQGRDPDWRTTYYRMVVRDGHFIYVEVPRPGPGSGGTQPGLAEAESS